MMMYLVNSATANPAAPVLLQTLQTLQTFLPRRPRIKHGVATAAGGATDLRTAARIYRGQQNRPVLARRAVFLKSGKIGFCC